MDIRHKTKVNEEIIKILNAFIAEPNDNETRQKIAYLLKCFLEKENIDYQTINLYTTPEKIDQGLVDIRVDDELYPFMV